MTTFTNYDIHICSLRLPIYPYMLSPWIYGYDNVNSCENFTQNILDFLEI